MSKKQKKEEVVELPNKQLWIVERRDVEPVRKIYVFSALWFDVRTVGAMKLETRGDYTPLFISAVMAEVDVFKGVEGVYDVQYSGNASNNTLEKKIVHIKKGR